MLKPVKLKTLEREYWHYHVEHAPEMGGFIVQNLHDARLPQGLTLCLPAEMDIAMNGDYLNPARFITDRYDSLADALGLSIAGFGGTTTSLMFCNFVQNYEKGTKLVTPMNPMDATHVMVRVGWNLLMDADLQGTQSIGLDHVEDIKVVYEWHDTDIDVMCGWDLLIIELGDLLSDNDRQTFADQMERIANLHDMAARAFEQEKGLYRAKYQELENRANAVGWKMNFGDDDADAVEVTYADRHGTHTSEYRYCRAYLNVFVAALQEQEAWQAQLSKPTPAQ